MESSLITAGLLGSIITIIIQALLNNWFEGVKNRREIKKLVFQRKTEIVEKAMLCYQNAIDAYLTLQTGLKGSNKDFINPIAVGNIQAAIDRLNKLSYDNENRIYLYYDFSDIVSKYHGRESMDAIDKLFLLVGEINQKISAIEPSEFSKQLYEALHEKKIETFHILAEAINNQICILTEIETRLRNEYKEYLK